MLRASRARPGDAFCPSVLRKQKLHQPGYPPKEASPAGFLRFHYYGRISYRSVSAIRPVCATLILIMPDNLATFIFLL